MLILQVFSLEPAHGYGIAQRLEQISQSVVQVNQGSLFRPSPAGTERMAEGRVEGIGNRARSQILFVDTFGARATRRRER